MFGASLVKRAAVYPQAQAKAMQKPKTSEALIRILRDGQFHSGESLGAQLGISRTAIWKAIHVLIERGLPIHSVSGKGYRLTTPLSLLNTTTIQTHLKNNRIDELIILDQPPSTNDYCLSNLSTYSNKIIACLAEQQTQGKGRRGREWVSPYGHNIYCSLLWHWQKDPSEVAGLSLACAVAVKQALNAYGVEQGLYLKWPNDVLFNDKKLAGILLEMVAQPYADCSVVIGVGINTHIDDDHAVKITQPFTALDRIVNTSIDRNRLAGLLLNALVDALTVFEREGLCAFLTEFSQADYLLEKPVVLHLPSQEKHGMAKGVSDKGELVLAIDGKREVFLSGEVSVRVKEAV